MPDQRFASTHLEFPRRSRYREQREDALRSCGTRTEVMVRRDSSVPMGAIVLLDPAPGSSCDKSYVVVAGSLTHHLKLGVNTVGRQRDNDIVVADPVMLVSRRHCTIVIHASGQAELFDLASLNGTFLNGRKVEDRSPLRSDDIVRLGRDLCFSIVLYNPIGN